jgi:predicted transcriptional regulator
MMINRDKYLIVKNILLLLSDGERTSTKIIYSCRLSNGQRIVYLQSLLEKGLITKTVEERGYKKTLYKITQKGLDVLQVLTNLYELCPFIMDAGLAFRKPQWSIV